ncbi:MAG: hypothetical protein AB8F26_03545 [Phycisphaerales bacterium]
MDDRQTQIRSGAGLDESRLNQDFIDFITKWSTPVLWLLVLVGGAWWGMRFLKERRIERTNQAYSSLTEAMSGGSPSPATLRNIATEFDGVGSVPELALLRTADIYLRSAIAGVEPGSEIDPETGRPVSETDELDEARAKSYLSQSADISRQILDLVGTDEGKNVIAMQAWMRLAAAQEGLGSASEAKASYASAADLASLAGYPVLEQLAKSRAEAVDSIVLDLQLPSSSELLPLPGEEVSEIESTGEFNLPEVIDPDANLDEEETADPAPADPAPADDAGSSAGSGTDPAG